MIMVSQTEIIKQIGEFVTQLRSLESSDKGLEMYEAIIRRFFKSDQKIKAEKILDPFVDFFNRMYPFLGNNMALALVPKDTVITYDVKRPGEKEKPIRIPLGKIIFNSKKSQSLLTTIREYLVTIGILMKESLEEASLSALKETLKKFPTAPSPQKAPTSSGDGGAVDEDGLDEDDRAFFASLPQIPGMDMKALAAMGKQTFGNIEPGADKEEMAEKLKEGVVGLIDSDMFKNLLAAVASKAESGELESFNGAQGAQQMQQLMGMGQAIMSSIAQQKN